jgi:hypothetical protein
MFQKTLILVVIFLLSSLLFSQSIENGSLAVSGVGWDITSGEGRENGPYNATFTYQASINSPFDINPTSGSGLVTLTSTYMSETQVILGAAEGQEVTLYADISIDASWTRLTFGFYLSGATWDIVPGGSIDVVPLVTPDTDGTLDTFTTVSVTVILPPLGVGDTTYRAFIGTACVPWDVGGSAGSQFAFDNVRINPPVAKASSWEIYQ